MNPAEYTIYTGCDPLDPVGSKEWTRDVPFPWWAQIIGAVMVMGPVLPMPILATWHFVKKHFCSKGTDKNTEGECSAQILDFIK